MIAKHMNRPSRILVVDDDPMIRELMDTVLRRAGSLVRLLNDQRQTLELVLHCPFDLVLIDICTPFIDGLSVTRQIRALRCAVPILGMTAVSWQVSEGLQAGMNHVIVHPLTVSQILDSVHICTDPLTEWRYAT